MKAGVDQIVSWSQTVFSSVPANQGEIFQVGIIIQSEVVEQNYLEKPQHVDLCGRNILSDNSSTFFVAEVAVFVIIATVCFSQAGNRGKILLRIFPLIGSDIKTALPSNSLRRASGE